MTAKKPVKKVDKSRQKKVSVTAKKVEDAVIAGKKEKQIATELGMSRGGVAKIKSKPEFQERINARVAAASDVTDKEIIGTLTEQMRGAITDVLPDDGGIISQIKKKKLGHLVKKIKVKREIEPGTLKQFELVEIEIHSSQTAAVHLAKIKGIEQQPRTNDADVEKWRKIALDISKKHKRPLEEVNQEIIAQKPELATLLIQ
jgi:hypothetical protein